MNIESRGRKFPMSEKVYGFMLSAYPPKHRAAYGAAMALLFRDQCRDAWDESKNFGLLKLWLRVLPDLAKTSIMERLAALNERKTMSDKLANLAAFGPSPKRVFTRVFVAVFLIVVIVSTAMTFILPESFASTAMIKLDQTRLANGQIDYDPYFLQTQFEIITSPSVLNPAIAKLRLNEAWGQKYFKGEKLKDEESFQILKARLSIAPVRGTALARITVYSEDRNEAAQIANAIAESYRDYSGSQMSAQVAPRIPSPSLVQIVYLAEPGKSPVKPNKPLNITFGVFIGILLAGIIGGAAALITSFKRKRRQNSVAPA